MSPSFRQYCTCGALIVVAVAGGIVHHDAESHTETFRPDTTLVVVSGPAASTSSAIASGYVLRAEPGRYVLKLNPAQLSIST